MARSKIDILISARDKASDKLKKINKLAGKMGKAFVAGGAIAGIALVGLTAKMIKMAAEEEEVTAITKNLLKKQGVSWDEVGEKTDKYLKKLEALTAFNDTDLQMAFNELISTGLSYKDAMSSMTAVTDLAVAKNIDLKTSAQLLGKAYVGQTGSLSRYGIILDVTKELTEEQTQALKDQKDKIDRAKTATQTINRAFANASSELRGLQKEYDATTGRIDEMSGALDDMSDDMEQNRIKIQEIKLTARKEGRDLTEGELADIDAIELANDELSLSFNKLKFAQSELKEEGDLQKESMEAQEETIKNLKTAQDNAAASIKTMTEEEAKLSKEFGEVSNIDKYNALMKQIETTMGGTAEAAGKTLAGQMKNLKNQIFNVAERIGDKLIPALTPLIKDMGERLPGAMKTVDKAFVRVTGLIEENSETIDKLKTIALNTFDALKDGVEIMASIWENNFLGIRDITKLVIDGIVFGFGTVLDVIIAVQDAQKLLRDLFKEGIPGFADLTGGIGSAIGSLNPFGDFIMRPGQAPIAFSPQDTVIGFKGSSPVGMSGGFSIGSLTINAGNSSGPEMTVAAKRGILQAWDEIRGMEKTNTVAF